MINDDFPQTSEDALREIERENWEAVERRSSWYEDDERETEEIELTEDQKADLLSMYQNAKV